jgi:hypothetical protein
MATSLFTGTAGGGRTAPSSTCPSPGAREAFPQLRAAGQRLGLHSTHARDPDQVGPFSRSCMVGRSHYRRLGAS